MSKNFKGPDKIKRCQFCEGMSEETDPRTGRLLTQWEACKAAGACEVDYGEDSYWGDDDDREFFWDEDD